MKYIPSFAFAALPVLEGTFKRSAPQGNGITRAYSKAAVIGRPFAIHEVLLREQQDWREVR